MGFREIEKKIRFIYIYIIHIIGYIFICMYIYIKYIHIYMEREIYYKKLFHRIIDVGKSQDL